MIFPVRASSSLSRWLSPLEQIIYRKALSYIFPISYTFIYIFLLTFGAPIERGSCETWWKQPLQDQRASRIKSCEFHYPASVGGDGKRGKRKLATDIFKKYNIITIINEREKVPVIAPDKPVRDAIVLRPNPTERFRVILFFSLFLFEVRRLEIIAGTKLGQIAGERRERKGQGSGRWTRHGDGNNKKRKRQWKVNGVWMDAANGKRTATKKKKTRWK